MAADGIPSGFGEGKVTVCRTNCAAVCVAEQRTEPELKLISNADECGCGATLQEPKKVSQ